MTDVNGIGAVENTASSYSQDALVASDPVSEKMLAQSQVDEIVKRAKNQAVENYKKLYVEQPEYAQKKYGDPVAAYAQPAPAQAPAQVNEGSYRQIAAEEAQRMRDEIFSEAEKRQNEEQAQRIVQSFQQKIETARGSYEDYDTVTGDMDLGAFPNTVQILAQHLDNAGDVLYELGANRLKLAELEMLAERSPSNAIAQAQRLSKAVKERSEAKGNTASSPREPLSKLQPNVNGSASNVSDWKELAQKWTA